MKHIEATIEILDTDSSSVIGEGTINAWERTCFLYKKQVTFKLFFQSQGEKEIPLSIEIEGKDFQIWPELADDEIFPTRPALSWAQRVFCPLAVKKLSLAYRQAREEARLQHDATPHLHWPYRELSFSKEQDSRCWGIERLLEDWEWYEN